MNTLIVYYSRTGCTRQVAQDLARLLGAATEELKETADRAGARGYMLAGRDAMLKHAADLLPVACRPEVYDLIVVATPVWAFTMCPAIRTWLTREAGHLPRVAFVCTQGGGGAERTMAEMAAVAGKEPVARLVLRDRAVRAGSCVAEVAAFAAALQAGGGTPKRA